MADESRLREELAQHLAELTAEYERQGLAPETARRAARLRLGGEEQIRVLWREARRFAWLEHWGRDLRLAARSLRRSPGYAAAVIITLALAIAANAAIFSVTDALLLRPLPYLQPQELVIAQGSSRAHRWAGISYPQFRAWRDQNHSFSGMAAWGGADGVLTGHGQAVHLAGMIVSANLFSLLGVRPAVGRFFRRGEDRPHADDGVDAIVISHRLFERRFAGRAAALGSVLKISGHEFVLVGVAPHGFVFPPGMAEDYWITAAAWAEAKPGLAPPSQSTGFRFLEPIARLRPGVTVEQATRDLDAVSDALRRQHHNGGMYSDARVSGFRQTFVAAFATELKLLWAGAGLVLLLACANLAGLGIARGVAQLPALRTRVALGARPRDLMAGMLAETAMLAVGGCAAGMALAWPVILELGRQMEAPGFTPILDGRVVGYTVALGVAAMVLIGCWPAWMASRGAAAADAARVTGGREAQRSRSALVVAEVAIALVLVAAAGLLGRTLYHLAHRDPGFDPRQVLTAQLTLPESMPLARRPEVVRKFLDRVGGLPGVTAASAGFTLPWSGMWSLNSLAGAGGTPMPRGRAFGFDVVQVTPGYFRSLRMPMLRGHGFDERDTVNAALVVVVNQRFVAELRQAMPSLRADAAVGMAVKPYIGNNMPARTIVGVVGDIVTPGSATHAALYLPYAQDADVWSLSLAVRAAQGDPMVLLPAVRRQLAEVSRDLALGEAQPLTANWNNWGQQPEMAAGTAGIFGILALLLAATGLYGLMAYAVRQRQRELGVRVALGAQRSDLYRLLLGMGLRLTVIGLGIGAAGIWAVRGLLGSQLYGLSPLDPATLAAATGVLAGAAVVACWLPARRAARTDPMRALRTE